MALPTERFNPGAPSQQVDPANFSRAASPSDNADCLTGGANRYVSIAKGTDALADLAYIPFGELAPVTVTLQTGVLHKIAVRRVMTTNTTATQVILHW